MNAHTFRFFMLFWQKVEQKIRIDSPFVLQRSCLGISFWCGFNTTLQQDIDVILFGKGCFDRFLSSIEVRY